MSHIDYLAIFCCDEIGKICAKIIHHIVKSDLVYLFILKKAKVQRFFFHQEIINIKIFMDMGFEIVLKL